MFNRREKIIKKDGAQPTELEEHVAKQLHALANKEKKKDLSIIFINSAQLVDYEDAAGSAKQYLLIRIPHRSLGAFKKAGALVQDLLEGQYEDKPVIIVANRTIISPSGKLITQSFLFYLSFSHSQTLPNSDETKTQTPHRSAQGDPQ